jgi:hypothetical protein
LSFLTELVATSYVDFLPPGKGSQYAYSSLKLQVTGEGPPEAEVPISRLQPEIHTTVEGVEAQQITNREMVLHLKAEFKLQKKKSSWRSVGKSHLTMLFSFGRCHIFLVGCSLC